MLQQGKTALVVACFLSLVVSLVGNASQPASMPKLPSAATVTPSSAPTPSTSPVPTSTPGATPIALALDDIRDVNLTQP